MPLYLLHSLNPSRVLLQGGNEAPQMSEDGMELEEAAKEVTHEPPAPPEPEVPSEFEKLFKECEANPEDFNSWVYLLQYVEQEVNNAQKYSYSHSLRLTTTPLNVCALDT